MAVCGQYAHCAQSGDLRGDLTWVHGRHWRAATGVKVQQADGNTALLKGPPVEGGVRLYDVIMIISVCFYDIANFND